MTTEKLRYALYDPCNVTKVDDDVKNLIASIKVLKSKAKIASEEAGGTKAIDIDIFDRQIAELQEVLDKLSAEPPGPEPTPIPTEPLYGLLKKNSVVSKNEVFHSPYMLVVFTDLDQARTAETAGMMQHKVAFSEHYPTLYRLVLEPVEAPESQ